MANIEACDVKEMLLDGATKEELMEALEKEIASAQEEIDQEKSKQKAEDDVLETYRMDVIISVTDYLNELGFIDSTKLTDEDFDEINDAVKALEEEYAPFLSFMKDVKKNKEKKVKIKSRDADEIIAKFLKSL